MNEIKLPPDVIEDLERLARERNQTMAEVLRSEIRLKPMGDLEQARQEVIRYAEAAETCARMMAKAIEGVEGLRAERDEAVECAKQFMAERNAAMDVAEAAQALHDAMGLSLLPKEEAARARLGLRLAEWRLLKQGGSR